MKIRDLIQPENILILESSPLTVEEALTISCECLLRLGKITEEYSKAVIESHYKMGPYYVLAPKIALPHARPENGVIEDSLQLTIFKKGMDFGNKDNGKAYLVITLAATDPNSHIQTIMALSELFENDNSVDALIQAKSTDEIIKILADY